MTVLLKAIYRFNAILIKIPTSLFVDTEKFILKFLYKKKDIYKKDLNDPDNHNGVITNLELDILECKDKWALGSITTNKANGGDRILAELFQILK